MEAKDGFDGAVSNACRVLGLCETARADLERQFNATAAVYRIEGGTAAGICEGVMSGLVAKELSETDPEKIAALRGRIERMQDLIGQLSKFRMIA